MRDEVFVDLEMASLSEQEWGPQLMHKDDPQGNELCCDRTVDWKSEPNVCCGKFKRRPFEGSEDFQGECPRTRVHSSDPQEKKRAPFAILEALHNNNIIIHSGTAISSRARAA